MNRVARFCKIAALQERAWVVNRVDLNAHATGKPALKLRFVRIDLIGKNAEGRTPIDRLQTLQDRLDKALIGFDRTHIVDGQDGSGFDPLLADPLRRG